MTVLWDLYPYWLDQNSRAIWPHRKVVEVHVNPGSVYQHRVTKPEAVRQMHVQFYAPTTEDLEIVSRFFPDCDSTDPPWEAIRAKLIVAGIDREFDMQILSAPQVLQLLGQSEFREADNREPTDAGEVQPDDDGDFVLITTLLNQQDEFETRSKLKRFLDETPEIRTRKPSKNRFEVHAGDWMRYWKSKAHDRFESLDSEGVQDALADYEARKDRVRNRRK